MKKLMSLFRAETAASYSFIVFASLASTAVSGCVSEPNADDEIASSESDLSAARETGDVGAAVDVCYTFYEHANFGGEDYSGCRSSAPGCINVLGYMNNRASSLTHNGGGVHLYDGAACSGTYLGYHSARSISNLHSFGQGDRVSSAWFVP